MKSGLRWSLFVPGNRLRTATLILVAVLAVLAVPAHEVPRGYIRHDLHVRTGADMLDVELTLIFHEQASLTERRAMDQDRDGRIDDREIRVHRDQVLVRAQAGLHLRINGTETPLIPLYPPDVDLLGFRAVDSAVHQVTLFFFARIPGALSPGALLEVTDALWLEVPAVRSASTEVADGTHLEALPDLEPSPLLNRTVEPLLFRVRFWREKP